MRKMIVLVMMLVFASSLYAQGGGGGAVGSKGGGNAQLVVIPNGGKDPVPYEIAKSWDSGVYRNFFKLPGINGTVERREKFNRNYGVHALPWLDLIQDYAPGLHKKLMNVARKTSFRLLSNYIYWEHVPYPAGEVDYKKYEKAALFNGEIILSIPVMDRIGRLENVLTKEQNQGFVIVHELLNAAFPKLTVKDKLDLGEIIANIELLHWSRTDFFAALIQKGMSSVFIDADQSILDILSGLKDLGEEEINGVRFVQIEKMVRLFGEFSEAQDFINGASVMVPKLKTSKEDAAAQIINYFYVLSQFRFETISLDKREKLMDSLLLELDKFRPKWSVVIPLIQSGSGIDRFIKNQRSVLINYSIHSVMKKLNEKSYANYEGGSVSGIYALHMMYTDFFKYVLDHGINLSDFDHLVPGEVDTREFVRQELMQHPSTPTLLLSLTSAYRQAMGRLNLISIFSKGASLNIENGDLMMLEVPSRVFIALSNGDSRCQISKNHQGFEMNRPYYLKRKLKNGSFVLKRADKKGKRKIKVNINSFQYCSTALLNY